VLLLVKNIHRPDAVLSANQQCQSTECVTSSYTPAGLRVRLRRRDRQATYDLGAGSVEDVARVAGRVERDEEQRSAVVDAVVADADQVAANDRDGALDRVETDEVRPARHRPRQRHVRSLGHLRQRRSAIAKI